MTQSRATTACQLSDARTQPIPVLGSQEGTGYVGSGASANSSTPLYITGLKENEVYELTFFLTSDLIDGVSDNVYIRPGGVASTAAVTTSSFLWPASKIPVIQIKLGGGQQSIGVLASSSNSVTVKWRRLT